MSFICDNYKYFYDNLFNQRNFCLLTEWRPKGGGGSETVTATVRMRPKHAMEID